MVIFYRKTRAKIIDSKESVKEWQLRLKSINQELDGIKEKKKKAMHSSGLKWDEEMAIENMPNVLQKIERVMIDKTTKKQKIGNLCEEATKSSARIEAKCNAKLKNIIELIEQDEYMRVSVIKQSLILGTEIYAQIFNDKLFLLDALNKASMNVNPTEDIQAFITKSSFYTSNEKELQEIYKSMGDSCYAEKVSREFRKKKTSKEEALGNKNREMSFLKCFQSRICKQQILSNLYPSTSLLQQLKVHNDLMGEDPNSIRFFLYLVLEYANVMNLDGSVFISRFTITTVGNSTNKKETIKNTLAEHWNIDKNKMDYARILLKSFKDTKKTKNFIKHFGLYTILVHLIKRWIKLLRMEKYEDTEIWFYKTVYCIGWSYIVW